MRKIITFIVIVFYLVVAIAPSINANIEIDKDSTLLISNGDFADNVDIKATANGFNDYGFILITLLWLPAEYINVRYTNNNDVKISVTEYYKVTTWTGRVIYDFSRKPFWKPSAGSTHHQRFMTRQHMFKELYTFGFFNFEFTIRVNNDNSTRTELFHGFIYSIGASIFNSEGKVID